MNIFEGTGLPVSVWFLIGLFTYIILVLFCLWIRFCAMNRMLCPNSPYLMCCSYYCNGCGQQIIKFFQETCSYLQDICPNCYHEQSAKNIFCCQNQHNISAPELNCECFTPNCNEINCLCFRLVVKKPEMEEGDWPDIYIKENENFYVQHI